MIKVKDIEQLVKDQLTGSQQFLVNVDVKPGNKILVFIDGDQGVTIADCVKLSRYIESELDREQEDYELNVSSPGADQPLKLHRQYVKNTGRSLRIKLDQDRIISGKLEEVTDEGIRILPDPDKKKKKEIPQSIFINFSEIIEAKVIISFK
jgi:ribosome maturation factor RimP